MTFGWHPRDHKAALDGMLMLTLEERGAYNTCLDLIYDRAGPIPDDARWLSGWMGVSLKRWASLRATLIVKGKLFAINVNGVDCLMNERAAHEIEKQNNRARNLREIGAKGGRNSAKNRVETKENNDIAEADAQATLKLKTKTETIGSVSPPNGEDTAAEAANVDPNVKAWAEAKALLVGQGGLSMEAAGRFFGKLLAEYRLEARDLLGAINEAYANGTRDPQGWLTKAAQARGRRRQATGPPKRVGFV